MAGPLLLAPSSTSSLCGALYATTSSGGSAASSKLRSEVVEARIRAALAHVPPSRVVVAPDCGMKYLARDVALGKLAAMVEGARRVRAALES